jgi:hypothetical protein
MMGAESFAILYAAGVAACRLVARRAAARCYGKAGTLRHGANAGLEYGPAGRYTEGAAMIKAVNLWT